MSATTEQPKCPKCGQWHQAYALFPPSCQYPNDPYTRHSDGRSAYASLSREAERRYETWLEGLKDHPA